MALIKLTGLREPIDTQTIICVTGDTNYAWLHCTRRQKHLLAITLRRVEEQVADFIRIHQSTLINPRHVTQLDNLAQHLLSIRLSNGMMLPVARRRVEAVRQQLDQLGIPMFKPTRQNIMTWWFAADTPIRQYKLSLVPALQVACEQVSQDFVAPSGASSLLSYRRADKLAFAKAVEQRLKSATPLLADELCQHGPPGC